MKTLDIRMKRHCENAMKVAKYLEAHPMVETVYYPGLESHPQHDIAKKQMDGFGGMIAIILKASREKSEELLNAFELCTLAVSLGDAETLVEHPASMTHSTYTEEELLACGLNPAMIRFSIGLEDPEDIIQDIENAFKKVFG
jgi:methionine-gamma-lyase